jgi:hypothetical protein
LISQVKLLIRTADMWLKENVGIIKSKPIRDIRVLKNKGKEYLLSLQKMSKKVNIPDLITTRTEVMGFIHELSDVEKELMDKASSLWKVNINSDSDLDKVETEINSLIYVFDGLDADLEDFLLMRRVVKIYRDCYNRLNKEDITWDEFECLTVNLIKRYTEELGDEEIPWQPEDVIQAFSNTIAETRNSKSQEMFLSLKNQEDNIECMNADEANNLLRKVSMQSPTLTDYHKTQIETLKEKITNHLDKLSLQWIVLKFKELPSEKKLEFIRIAKTLLK